MIKYFKTLFKGFDVFLSWLGVMLKQSSASYCEVQTADSSEVLVANDGSLLSVIKLSGVTTLIGKEEFDYIQSALQQTFQTTMSQPGHIIQVLFSHDKSEVLSEIKEIFKSAYTTADKVNLKLDDLFREREKFMSKYCAHEEVYIVLWTRLNMLTNEQLKRAKKDKLKTIKAEKLPVFRQTQNITAAMAELRESHDSFVRSVCSDFSSYDLDSELLEVHAAIHAMRRVADPEFTAREWRPFLPGDKITIKEIKSSKGEVSDILWPSLAKQILPRDGQNIDLRTCRVGDRIYSTVYIDLFPREVQSFLRLFSRTLQTHIPWRISFLVESDGLGYANTRAAVASVLTVTSSRNRLLADSLKLLSYIKLNTDNAVVRLRVSATTWAPVGQESLLRSRVSMLSKAIQGWGSCDVSEISGDPFAGFISTALGLSCDNVANPSIAPLSDVLHMMPFFRPSSPWKKGALLFRSPDGKLWPFHPGSTHQNTWIDLFYARPGSGKSVTSNAINLAVCLSPGLQRLPRIAIIDVGPSSSGLISLLKDALPVNEKHLVAYHRLRMTTNYSINPFDTQLGCRFPTPQDRSFLVNFICLLATPVGSERTYDGVADMSGLIIDELYKNFSDDENPNIYATNVQENVDGVLEEIGFIVDSKTTWWETADALFMAGFVKEAMIAQRYAMPVLADVMSICRLSVIEDLYKNIIAPTGEPLIQAFSRMISSAVREYPIISQVTRFDLGDAKVVSLDLDEVAKSGGDAANRQTSVMYMLARYVLARHYYLTLDNVNDMPEVYRSYHHKRITEIREDPKRIVYDEFHRTSSAKAVRDQVIVDMREGRKWGVQVALLSQSLDDFDSVMVEFATSVFVMEAGPEQAIAKTAKVFGLSETAKISLRNRVHGPRASGTTFLAQFATKYGNNTQLLTLTLGPIELWALNTTSEDVIVRTQLYKKLGPKVARRVLAQRFPEGSAARYIEHTLAEQVEVGEMIDQEKRLSVIDILINELVENYESSHVA